MSRRGTIDHEHSDLRLALQAAEAALAELEARKGKVVVQSTTQGDRWGAVSREGESGPRSRTHFTAKLRQVWDSFVEALQAHMEHEELVLPSLVERLDRGEADAHEVRVTLGPLFEEHETLHGLLSELRRAILGIDPVRQPMDRVITSFLRHTEEEDTRVFPLLYRHAGIQLEAQPVHQRYSVEAALNRTLRAAVSSRDEEQPIGFFDRIKSIFGRT